MDFTHKKGALRETVAVRRRALDEIDWRKLDTPRLEALLGRLPGPGIIIIYASRRHEPNTLVVTEELRKRGWQVLLPKLSWEPSWAWTIGEFRSGWASIPEPTGPDIGIKALGQADVVVVSCLVVSRDSSRLDMGGGWYDRAFRHCRPGTPIWVLANVGEVLPALPSEPHDLPVNTVATENGFTRLGAGGVFRFAFVHRNGSVSAHLSVPLHGLR